MLFALTLLLTCTFTCVGLLALWAATSTRHWFVRTAVFLGTLAPLLAIPACEPLVTLTVQGITVIAAVIITRWIQNRKPKEARVAGGGFQFGMGDMLLATVVVSYLLAVASQFPSGQPETMGLTEITWLYPTFNGFAVGLITSLAYWITTSSGKRLAIAACFAILGSLAFALIAAYSDWIVVAFVEYDSFMSSLFMSKAPQGLLAQLGEFLADQGTGIWLVIGLTHLVLTAATFKLFSLGSAAPSRFATTMSVVCVLVMASFPMVTYWHLATPPAKHDVTYPNPNGYEQLVGLAKTTETAIVNGNFDSSVATKSQREAAAAEVDSVVSEVHDTLALPSVVRIQYDIDTDLANISSLRSLARAMTEVGGVHAMNGRWQQSLDTNLDLVDYGARISQGGLLIDDLVGIACSGMGKYGINEIHRELDESQRKQVARRLSAYLNGLESAEEFIERDQIWEIYATGWIGALRIYLQSYDAQANRWENQGYLQARKRNEMEVRLLLAAIAIEDYRAAYDRLPDSLEETSPIRGLESLVDPFDPAGGLLRYRRLDENQYLLYTIGANGTDEAGRYSLDDHLGDENDVTLESHFERERLEAEAAAAEAAELAAEQAELDTLEEELEDKEAQP
ncbi:hypothetical protein [Adhaeretor mobilis]|uniref:Uncharacterized protein n=1 Tax=Adhaeretor mobilis TaxID=1930276 RepID=A0A517MT34_9BACT|nr:hypothetical protein [Adhaeretor mobilis]QDS98044.1 hypothetical protein HG15A2_13140 [Adhaeretor mobilis]